MYWQNYVHFANPSGFDAGENKVVEILTERYGAVIDPEWKSVRSWRWIGRRRVYSKHWIKFVRFKDEKSLIYFMMEWS